MKKTIDLESLLRPNIRRIVPYSSARSEYFGDARIFLDANENYRNYLGESAPRRNRYPDPLQRELKARIAYLLGVEADQLFLGNGSDEAIDLLYRAFVRPGTDSAVIMPPTYGVYRVFADLNDAGITEVPLQADFSPDLDALEQTVNTAASDRLKLLFVCTPNNPTGNSVPPDSLKRILELFPGIVAVDEAYQDFSREPSALTLLGEYGNLVVLRTFSKAWGLAGVRFGIAAASREIAEVLSKIKYPYNVGSAAMEEVAQVLDHRSEVMEGIAEIIRSREDLVRQLSQLAAVRRVHSSQANFLLVEFDDAEDTYRRLSSRGIIVRSRTREPGCRNTLRITVGSPQENAALIAALREMEGEV
jgi:histidinol-phosphate aminotransferase